MKFELKIVFWSIDGSSEEKRSDEAFKKERKKEISHGKTRKTNNLSQPNGYL